MISLYSVLFALVVFSAFSCHTVSLAVPAGKLDDGLTGQSSLGSLLADQGMDRRSPIMDNNLGDEDRSPKIIILSDVGLRGHSLRGLSPMFPQSLPLLTERSVDTPLPDYSLKIDRRESDLDILRCMIGRVYRPCWQA